MSERRPINDERKWTTKKRWRNSGTKIPGVTDKNADGQKNSPEKGRGIYNRTPTTQNSEKITNRQDHQKIELLREKYQILATMDLAGLKSFWQGFDTFHGETRTRRKGRKNTKHWGGNGSGADTHATKIKHHGDSNHHGAWSDGRASIATRTDIWINNSISSRLLEIDNI